MPLGWPPRTVRGKRREPLLVHDRFSHDGTGRVARTQKQGVIACLACLAPLIIYGCPYASQGMIARTYMSRQMCYTLGRGQNSDQSFSRSSVPSLGGSDAPAFAEFNGRPRDLRLLLRRNPSHQPAEGLSPSCVPSPSRNRCIETRRQVDALSTCCTQGPGRRQHSP